MAAVELPVFIEALGGESSANSGVCDNRILFQFALIKRVSFNEFSEVLSDYLPTFPKVLVCLILTMAICLHYPF
jgi:hypothetical protein